MSAFTLIADINTVTLLFPLLTQSGQARQSTQDPLTPDNSTATFVA